MEWLENIDDDFSLEEEDDDDFIKADKKVNWRKYNISDAEHYGREAILNEIRIGWKGRGGKYGCYEFPITNRLAFGVGNCKTYCTSAYQCIGIAIDTDQLSVCDNWKEGQTAKEVLIDLCVKVAYTHVNKEEMDLMVD